MVVGSVVGVVGDCVRRLDGLIRKATHCATTGSDGKPAEDLGVVAAVEAIFLKTRLEAIAIDIALTGLTPVSTSVGLDLSLSNRVFDGGVEGDVEPVETC